MYIQTIRQLLIVMHISGLALMAASIISGFVTFRTLINRLKIKNEGLILQSNLGHLFGFGGMLLVLSGTGLIIITGGVFLHMLWLQVKLFLSLLLLFNDKLVGNRLLKKLTENFSATKITIYYTVQLFLLLGIIILAVFKFN